MVSVCVVRANTILSTITIILVPLSTGASISIF